ncbi:Pantothenate kinase [Vigna angularis]|uniref:Pantothenate kinase n=1 Tax=Phaseolus angularis TaxID=3914 RepID=A0A8T0KHN6_PHAAN|nr:Pantothenate kinase [Vigna angularis]
MAASLEKEQKQNQVIGIIEEEKLQKQESKSSNKITRTQVESGEGEREMTPTASNSMHRSGSRPQLDVSKAEIQVNEEEKYPTILLPNQSDDLSHLALDIGGSLIKLVYFSRHENQSVDDKRKRSVNERLGFSKGNRRSYPILGGRLHFVKFETRKINECLDFIHSKQLHCGGLEPCYSDGVTDQNGIIKATGGGAYKYADLFKERLGVSLDKEDEMDCLVAGANFLLKAIRHEAFTHMEGQKEFVQIEPNDLFPYLLVNIGSGVSMIKIGLSASTIASSFGKTISEKKELEEYRPEDISLSLLRMISYNIGQIAYLNALRFRLKRIFFGGFFIRGHAYTMDTISFAVHFWSNGEAQAMFLRHEGFLGALGAFMSYEKHGLDDLMVHQLVERFPMGAPYTGGKIHGPPLGNLNEKAKFSMQISWMEKFLRKGTEITAPVPMTPLAGTTGLGGFEVPLSKGSTLRSDASALSVGVLHLVPTLEVFPLLADPKLYEPNTIDLSDNSELEYWLTILSEHLSDLVDKAVASEGGTDDAKRRGDAFARAFSAHLARLMEEPSAYGKLGLANLLEMREECLREFHFVDAYRSIKQRENEASLAVLPDLLVELDSMDEESRLLTLIEGVLAANIFDWGSRACVDLYHKGTIIEIYRMSRNKMRRPWRVDDFDDFKERMLGAKNKKNSRHKRALLFVDNSGADIVLGMLPLARELLRRGTELDCYTTLADAYNFYVTAITTDVFFQVVLVANSLPALNDVTAMELPDIIAEAAKLILEGMGRALHTNLNARFKCDALKLAMVKNQRLAEKLVKGDIYDCICKYEPVS